MVTGEGQHSSAPGPGTEGVEVKGPGDPTPRLVWTQRREEVQAQLLGEVALVQAYELEAAKLDFGVRAAQGRGRGRCGGERAGLGPAAVGEGGGPRGESAGRLPTAGPNVESARTYRHLLSDVLARWVQLELVCGPYKKDELPWVSVIGGELFLDASLHSDQGGCGERSSHCGRLFSPREGRGGCEWAGPTVGQCRHQCEGLSSANRWDGAHS